MDYLIAKTESDNYYLYSFLKKQVYNISKTIYLLLQAKYNNQEDVLKSQSKVLRACSLSEIKEAKDRIKYYKSQGVFDEVRTFDNYKVSADLIKMNLANNPQIALEITEKCNLNCTYCGYGDFYCGYDETNRKADMPLSYAINIIDFCVNYVVSKRNLNVQKEISLSFYGGEPLIRIDFIKKIVSYCEILQKKQNIKFNFYMTTNAVLLNRFHEYLVEKKFNLLISLDGNKFAHSYRVFKNGQNSFDVVFNNIKHFQNKYPKLFNSSRVNFNVVLHDRNSVKAVNDFFWREFMKTPSISELSTTSISPDKRKDFDAMFKSVYPVTKKESKYYALLSKDKVFSVPYFMDAVQFLFRMSDQVYENYFDLRFQIRNKYNKKVNGTCIPFSKKVFVTARGKILPCEMIDFSYNMGTVDDKNININFEKIAEEYNAYNNKMFQRYCKTCWRANTYCNQCLFSIDPTVKDKVKCPEYTTRNDMNLFFF